MNGAEREKPFSVKYWKQLPKEMSGVGLAQRALKEAGSLNAPVGFIAQFLFPLDQQVVEKGMGLENPTASRWKLAGAIITDVAADSLAYVVGIHVNPWMGGGIKLSYNFLAQVAPDLAKLAMDKTSQLKKIGLTS